MIACDEADKRATETSENIKAFVGVLVIDGTGKNPIEDGILITQAGQIREVGITQPINSVFT